MAQRVQGTPVIRNIGTNVRFVQRGKGKTNEQMAAVICRDQRTWHNRMKDPGTFTLLELAAVSKYLGVTLEKLMGDPSDLCG